MTEERDPDIQALFAQAEEPLEDTAFSETAAARVAALQRRARLRRWAFAIVLLLVLLFAAPPLQAIATGLAGLLALPIVRVDNPLLAQLLLPVNNSAFILALLLLCWRAFRARLFT